MSEPVTFRSISNVVQLERVMSAMVKPPTWTEKGQELATKIIVDFIDALMTHLSWPNESWAPGDESLFRYDGISGFVSIALDLKMKDGASATVVLNFQPTDDEIKMVSYDRSRFIATLPLSKERTAQDTEALSEAGKTMLEAAKSNLPRR